jgi:RNA polymerase sigma-70 factor (ECF subfamily)
LSAAIFEASYRIANVEPTPTAIIRSIAPVGDETFEQLFKTHFRGLYAYALTIVQDEIMAEELVQNMFCRLWEKKSQLEIHTSLKAYLYKTVYHDSLNYLKHQKVRAAHAMHVVKHAETDIDNAADKAEAGQLDVRIHQALGELPEQCRTIFQLSRFEGLKYHEIAQVLQLSVKTVENQMGKALKLLRIKLRDYLPLLAGFLLLNTMPVDQQPDKDFTTPASYHQNC